MRAGRKQVWLAASVAAGVLALGVWALFFRSDSSRSIRRSVPIASLPAGRRPADLKVAMLFDCYEHGLENVPPRWDTSSRQRNWKAPPPPLPLLKSALNGSEPKLLSWMEAWDESLRKGIGMQAVPQELPELEGLLRETALPFDVLFKVGLAVSFLDSDAHAACWFRAAIGRAAQECKAIPGSDPRAQSLLQALPQMAVLWRLGDYAALERRFTLERALYPPSGADSRRAGHLRAEMLYHEGMNTAAADLIVTIGTEHYRAGDLAESDFDEVHWVAGLLFYGAGRYNEAIPHLEAVLAQGTHAQLKRVPMMLCIALAKTGQVREAEQRLDLWRRSASPSFEEVGNVLEEIHTANLHRN